MSIKIPAKCSERWDDMTSTARGMLCSKCNVEVIDFTDWKTQDIINYVQGSPTKVCGRISTTQSKTRHKPLFFERLHFPRLSLGLVLSGLLFTKSVKAENYVNNVVSIHCQDQEDLKDSVTIQGLVTDRSGNPLAYVQIRNILSGESFSTDDKGKFVFKFSNKQNLKYLPLSFHFIGYESLKIKHNLSKNKNIKLKLTQYSHEIGEVIVEPLRRKPNTDMPKHRN